jgi:uncharacterized membrane protein
MPRPPRQPPGRNSTWLILAGLIVLGILTGLVIRFALPSYQLIDNLPDVRQPATR